jgi:hypothetical protein
MSVMRPRNWADERRGHARMPPPARKPARLGVLPAIIGPLVLLGCGSGAEASITASRSAGSSSHATTATVVEPGLPGQPGVVSLLRLRAPAGHPATVTLTAQVIHRNGGLDLCLYASQVAAARGAPIGYSTGQCAGPLPLARRAIVTVATAGWCTPKPVELVWGIARSNVTMVLVSPAGPQVLARSHIPSRVNVPGDLFYGFVRGAPVKVIARNAAGRTLATVLVNQAPAPYGCSTRTIGPGPTAEPRYPPR